MQIAMTSTPTLFVLLFCNFFLDVKLLENGLARTPPMGWMSWGYYQCSVDCEINPSKCLNEQLLLAVADKFYSEGYMEAGFEYIIIDDCWSEKRRNQFGRLVPDKKRFPRGMKYIADYIHKRGMKFGMYTNIAKKTCMGYPGSRGYFKPDANMFARWGVDYLKVDGCFVDENFLNVAYKKLGEHIDAAERPMVYSCSWPYYIEFIHNKKPNYTTVAQHCNMWRNYHDVALSWDAVKAIITHYQEAYSELSPHHGPGRWNDPDMLILGTGALTDSQSRVQLSVYAMLSAPLLLSCDMDHLTAHERGLLTNLDLMAIAQDPLGVMARPYKLTDSITLWVKPHLPKKADAYNSVSFALVNLTPDESSVSLAPGRYGLNSTDYTIMDIFSRTYLRNITVNETLTLTVPAEDVVLYTLYPL